jgi:hypothetical protein
MRPRPRKPVTTPATRAPRTHVHAKVSCHIEVPGIGESTGGQVLNLSPGGVRVATDQVLPKEAECEVHLQFGGDPPDIWVKGWVAYTHEEGLAIQFDHLTPEARLAIEQIMARFLETA